LIQSSEGGGGRGREKGNFLTFGCSFSTGCRGGELLPRGKGEGEKGECFYDERIGETLLSKGGRGGGSLSGKREEGKPGWVRSPLGKMKKKTAWFFLSTEEKERRKKREGDRVCLYLVTVSPKRTPDSFVTR